VLEAEQLRLERRLRRFGEARDATDIWASLGVTGPAEVPALATEDFLRRAADKRETADDAR
jgi:malonate decarboxylase beta subunit